MNSRSEKNPGLCNSIPGLREYSQFSGIIPENPGGLAGLSNFLCEAKDDGADLSQTPPPKLKCCRYYVYTEDCELYFSHCAHVCACPVNRYH